MKEKLKKVFDGFWTLSNKFRFDTILEKSSQPFYNEEPNFTDDIINSSYRKDNKKWSHSEYIKVLKQKITIEPDYSFCITSFNKIIQSSVHYPNLTPSFPRYIINLIKNQKSFYPKVILFDGNVGSNYFHFFSDIFNKYWLIQQLEDYEKIPVVIGEKTYNTKYFQYFLEHSELKKINWVVQRKNQYISTDEVLFIKPMPYKKEYFEKIKKLVIKEDSSESRRIFLNRSKKTGRYIENFHEIEPILKKYRFEIVDTNNTTLAYQAKLFNSMQYLISIHGAGETNIIFSRKSLNFLELNPKNRVACQYYWLSKELGIDYYDVILGGKLPSTHVYPEKGFHLNPQKLEEAIIRMINQ